LGSNTEFLWAPLPSPTFSLLTGQWLDFHQLADYHASRTTIKIPADIVKRLRSHAQASGMTIGEIVAQAIVSFLDKLHRHG
jgi:LDH2 family malate/lactate/ureidoglycolate dehydrogenase